jgi:virginiamycin B lyase
LSKSSSADCQKASLPDDSLWFTEVIPNAQSGKIVGKIGRITPDGQISEFLLPSNSFAASITTGRDGNLWFIEPGKIGRITPSGTISEFPLSSNNQPGDITVGPDDNLWFTGSQIGRITPSGRVSEFPMPTPSSNPGGITTGPDDALWFTEYQSNKIGRLT